MAPHFWYDIGMLLWISFSLIVVSAVGLVASTRTRSAGMARLAKSCGCVFQKHRSNITTPLTAGRLEFFTKFFHQYRNVFTYSDPRAFVRLADDMIYLDDSPKAKPVCLTVFTAELKKRQFPQIKVAPLISPFAPSQYALMKTNIPAIDSQYRIHTPSAAAGVLFTAMITGMLKTRPQVYLELNENALVYHEHTLVPLQEIEAFRFRAMQLLAELESIMEKLDKNNPDTSFSSSHSPAEEDNIPATLLARLGARPTQTGNVGAPPFRAIWLVVLLLIFVGITLLSWFALHNWIGR